MMCFWGEEIRPAGFGLVKADSVNLTETGIGFISPKSSIRGVCEGKDQILFIRGEGIVSVLKLNTGANCRSAKLKTLELKKEKIRLISCGEAHAVLLAYGGKVLFMDESNSCRPIKELCNRTVIQVACGNQHSMALTNDGQLFLWGQNTNGQLGLGKDEPKSLAPQPLKSLCGIPLAQISAGGDHSFALSLSGAVFGWGKNSTGQLGLGHTEDVYSPTCVSSLSHKKTVSISCGEDHTATLSKGGTVFTFGAGHYGQLGHNSFRNELQPRVVAELWGVKVSQIACGRYYTLALVKSSKMIYSFGCGEQGQLGNGQRTNQCVPIPVHLPSGIISNDDHTVENISAGGNHSFVLSSSQESKNSSEPNHKEGIVMLEGRMIDRWISNCDSDQWTTIKNEIKDVFSSVACLNGSFINTSCDRHYQTSSHFSGLDLDSVRAAFEQIAQKEKVLQEVKQHKLFVTVIEFDLTDWTIDDYWTAEDEGMLKTEKRTKSLDFLISSPCIFNLEAKCRLLNSRELNAIFKMEIRRTSLLEDCFHRLRISNEQTLKNQLLVVYCENFKETEVNKKDFFYKACKELLAPESEMFMYSNAESLIWFPSEPSVPEERYFLLGILCGLAFYNNSVVNLPFPLALFKKLLDIKPSLQDFAELSPRIAQSLQYVLNYPDDDVENMDMYYTIEWNNNEVELDPDEPGKLVTSSNRQQFVDAYVDYVLNKSVEKVFEEFKRGFYKVCDRDLVKLFRPEELRGVMLGTEEYDWHTLKQNATYEGLFHKDHPTIVLFWELFDELSEQDKKLFLLFVTGFDRVPLLGMTHMSMTVRHLYHSTQDHLPQAHTCCSILELPLYQSKETFKQKLTEALHHKRGFWHE
ncbi:probable E3 ubiquitin-protein ligase HERC3 [Trichomycterus rosablanca]|uniref:probable E3 ubiquitin-protein ligase HERC3 n=1 Tax=Trichomycterus rosablanca TaxID=2290929 RepID=UPI002F359836